MKTRYDYIKLEFFTLDCSILSYNHNEGEKSRTKTVRLKKSLQPKE